MNAKIWRVFASLGIPGLALGVLLVLFKQLNFQFETIPANYAGIAAILFIVLTSGVIYYSMSIASRTRSSTDAPLPTEAKEISKTRNRQDGEPGLIEAVHREREKSGRTIVTILSPLSGERWPHAVPMHGEVFNLPRGKELWIVKEPNAGNFHPDTGPVMIEGEKWIGTAFIGNHAWHADTGRDYLVHVVMTTHETGRKFTDYLDLGRRTGSWVGLPSVFDGRMMANVRVIRDDSVAHVASAEREMVTDSPLSSLNTCYSMWSDESLTKLQKQRFEKDYVGKKVSWKVRVDSVTEAKHERIGLFVTDPAGDSLGRSRAYAEFAVVDEELLLGLKKGDRIELRGTIEQFFLWPALKDCEIVKNRR